MLCIGAIWYGAAIALIRGMQLGLSIYSGRNLSVAFGNDPAPLQPLLLHSWLCVSGALGFYGVLWMQAVHWPGTVRRDYMAPRFTIRRKVADSLLAGESHA